MLEEGVRFHNDREMTAEDVKFSLERILEPDTGSRRRQNLEQIESIEVIDNHTVAIHLSTPFAPFLSNLVGVWAAIIPEESVAEDGTIAEPVGTGPFAFGDYAMNENLTLERFDDYWRPDVPYLDEVVLMPLSDDAARMVALRTGAVDLVTSVPEQLLPTLMANEDRGFELLVAPGTTWRMAIMNNTRPPFDDVRVRQAVNLAVDREEVMLARTFGFGTLENQIWDEKSFWRMAADVPQRDVEKARDLLAEAGYPDGLPVTIEARSTYLDDAQVVQGHLNEAGFQAEIAISDWAVLSDRMRSGEYDIAISGAGWYADPDGRYGRFYTPDGPANYFAGGYENPEVTELLRQAREQVDPKARKDIYQEIFDIIQAEVPHVMLYFAPNTMAWRPEVKGFRTDRQGGLSNADTGLAYVWLDR
ncbi:peptide/nickel transport system substrate-binding protein [Salinihabitans flavidus]|uniref:Peptide/nickel transport system substrate-binding protein n=1 Tax=Salinihabitans flavidus TaxID=569882 RepID=A0A1H8URM8_9RHOB|nr:ABC transporter substrate-binding protein [Salinihabitans flavidus]SEP05855.1 peptide/nickel transport system substrate-binding protein [Salinihabitans flavidus]